MAFYQPAEWAAHESVWIGFPSHPQLWLKYLAPAQREVAAFARAVAAAGRGETVYLVAATPAAGRAAQNLAGDCATVIVEPCGDIWLRDTAAIIVCEGNRRVALDYPGNGWGGKYILPDDDTIGRRLATRADLEIVSRDMIFEGGAVDVDGAGLGVTTRQCLLNPNRNPGLSRIHIERQLREDLGIRRMVWFAAGLANDHTDGHVDNLARFVGPGLLAIPLARGGDDPNEAVFAAAREQATAAAVDVVDVPSVGRLLVDGEVVPASHMNFYIGNVTVVVPTYGSPSDDAAVAAISELFPGRKTVGLPANNILTGGGSFHCISQQVPRV